jgi:hypothetical protein
MENSRSSRFSRYVLSIIVERVFGIIGRIEAKRKSRTPKWNKISELNPTGKERTSSV